MANVALKSISVRGIVVDVDGRTNQISWSDLRSASSQEDQALSQVYGGLLAEARRQAEHLSPLVVSYGRDETNVWFTASVWTLWGGFGIGARAKGLIAADEGGTLPQGWMAEREAQAIAERARKRWPGRDIRVQSGHGVAS